MLFCIILNCTFRSFRAHQREYTFTEVPGAGPYHVAKAAYDGRLRNTLFLPGLQELQDRRAHHVKVDIAAANPRQLIAAGREDVALAVDVQVERRLEDGLAVGSGDSRRLRLGEELDVAIALAVPVELLFALAGLWIGHRDHDQGVRHFGALQRVGRQDEGDPVSGEIELGHAILLEGLFCLARYEQKLIRTVQDRTVEESVLRFFNGRYSH